MVGYLPTQNYRQLTAWKANPALPGHHARRPEAPRGAGQLRARVERAHNDARRATTVTVAASAEPFSARRIGVITTPASDASASVCACAATATAIGTTSMRKRKRRRVVQQKGTGEVHQEAHLPGLSAHVRLTLPYAPSAAGSSRPAASAGAPALSARHGAKASATLTSEAAASTASTEPTVAIHTAMSTTAAAQSMGPSEPTATTAAATAALAADSIATSTPPAATAIPPAA